MAIFAADLVHENEIRNRVSRLEALFPDEVARIDYRYGEDWSGDPSIFFEVHLTPHGSSPVRFKQFAREFRTQRLIQVRSEELGLHSYVNFVNGPDRA